VHVQCASLAFMLVLMVTLYLSMQFLRDISKPILPVSRFIFAERSVAIESFASFDIKSSFFTTKV